MSLAFSELSVQWQLGVVGVLVAALVWVALVVLGWVFACRGVASGERRLLSFFFAIIGTVCAPLQVVPIILNSRG